MSSYSEQDLPVRIHHGEIVTLSGGTAVRFESNGDAKDVFLGDEFAPVVQLFPNCDYRFNDSGATYRIEAMFEDAMLVEKV